jgi:predicted nucleic-acid-binding Zn-ribbon protein
MIISTEYLTTMHTRKSKLGVEHSYLRKKTMLVIRCDNCGITFSREKGSMAPARVSNQVYHVCSNCDVKSFAQSKGVEKRNIWNMPVSSLKNLSEL